MTSVLVQVSPFFEIYVAKVFGDRDDVQDGRPNDIVAHRVANVCFTVLVVRNSTDLCIGHRSCKAILASGRDHHVFRIY